jgi:hypothetical protein
VAESGTTRPQGTVRNLIRSHARRKVKRTRDKPGQDVQMVSRVTRIKLPDPHGARGNHVFDPFSPLPSVAPGEFNVVQELLQHCKSIIHNFHLLAAFPSGLEWANSFSRYDRESLLITLSGFFGPSLAFLAPLSKFQPLRAAPVLLSDVAAMRVLIFRELLMIQLVKTYTSNPHYQRFAFAF